MTAIFLIMTSNFVIADKVHCLKTVSRNSTIFGIYDFHTDTVLTSKKSYGLSNKSNRKGYKIPFRRSSHIFLKMSK